ncbi:MAG: ASPIC/UnbV domain-containing protein [Acidobacteriota bacterium]|nr:MAG: ASPIC/UnbV domain-containing protein [Acidobacteriota bacterium]
MDNDGDLDIYTGNLAHWWGAGGLGHDISYLWRNDGDTSGYSFTDIRSDSGMHAYTPDPFDSENDFEEAGPGWGDFDNDTIPDVYVTEFYPFRDHWGRLYRGLGGGTFEDVTDPGNGDCEDPAAPGDPNPINYDVGPTCLKRWYSWNAAWADYDGDGDLDLALSGYPRFNQCNVTPMPAECGSADPGNRDSWPQPARLWLFRNDVGAQNNWLHLRLVGQLGNRAAIGARVSVDVGATTMTREVSGGHGYHAAQHDLPVEFGLTNAAQADAVTIRWPSPGFPTTSLTDVGANQRLVAYETGGGIQRGDTPTGLGPYETSEFFPWADPEQVLDPAVGNRFYRLDDTQAEIRVEKDVAGETIVIVIVN